MEGITIAELFVANYIASVFNPEPVVRSSIIPDMAYQNVFDPENFELHIIPRINFIIQKHRCIFIGKRNPMDWQKC